MGFIEATSESLKYTRSFLRKKNLFKSQYENWVINAKAINPKPVKFTPQALQRIKDQHRKDAVKVITLLLVVLGMTYWVILKVLF